MSAGPDLPAPPAARLRRPSWRDPRLLLGLVMVGVAVALGSWTVAAADETVPVFAARTALTPGQPVDADVLTTTQVRIVGGTQRHYLRADEPLPDGLVAVRVVEAGELVPRSALGEPDAVDVRPVAVPVDTALPSGVRAGSRVDLWYTPGRTDPGGPRPVAADLVVAELTRPAGGLGLTSAPVVHLLVPTDALPDVLGAIAADGAVAVVLVPGAGGTTPEP